MSKNFHRYEFACKCGCGFDAQDEELTKVLEAVRAKFGNRPVTINSGCRCKIHNAKVGGSSGSMHTKAMAADFVIPGVDPGDVYMFLNKTYPNRYGVGLYPNWVHLDVRPMPGARWEQT